MLTDNSHKSIAESPPRDGANKSKANRVTSQSQNPSMKLKQGQHLFKQADYDGELRDTGSILPEIKGSNMSGKNSSTLYGQKDKFTLRK